MYKMEKESEIIIIIKSETENRYYSLKSKL